MEIYALPARAVPVDRLVYGLLEAQPALRPRDRIQPLREQHSPRSFPFGIDVRATAFWIGLWFEIL